SPGGASSRATSRTASAPPGPPGWPARRPRRRRPAAQLLFFCEPHLLAVPLHEPDDVAERGEARDLLEVHVLDVRDLPLERREDLDPLDRVDPEVGLEVLIEVQDLDGVA